jgi:hypothetical protein
MMNLIEKIHAVMVHPVVGIWHYPSAKVGQFAVYSKKGEGSVEGEKRYETLEEMIEAAYAIIDPLKIPLPEQIPQPPSE